MILCTSVSSVFQRHSEQASPPRNLLFEFDVAATALARAGPYPIVNGRHLAGYNGARMGLTSGSKLGPYETQSPLGAGGMGEVEPSCGRERSGSPQAKSRAQRGI